MLILFVLVVMALWMLCSLVFSDVCLDGNVVVMLVIVIDELCNVLTVVVTRLGYI